MTRKWMEWWRLILIAVMIGAILFVVLESSETGYLIVQVLLLFGVLFFGYRFGPGAGAIVGTISGVVLSFLSGELAQMGVLCLLGVFSGAFRRLGRMASVTAYAAAAFGVGILYSPLLLFQTMESVMAGGAVFLLLPRKLTEPQEEQMDAEAAADSTEKSVWQSSLEGPVGEQLRQLAQTFSALAAMYREEELAGDLQETDWRLRYLELRQLLSEQLGECGEMLQDSMDRIEGRVDVPDQIRQALIQQLGRAGVEVRQVYMVETRNHKKELLLSLLSRSARCISMKLVSERVEDALGRKMIPCADQPLLVSTVPRWVRFEEECPYFTLFGAAGGCKSGNDTSGDSFFSLELPGGRRVLFLCDGMGSGLRAGRESSRVTELAEMMCRAGYTPSMLVRVINSALMIQAKEHPVTIDLMVLDCMGGMCELTKSGAAATFLKRGDEVELLGADTMPAGILQEYAPMEKMFRLRDGDLLIMVSDGVLEEMPSLDKEEAMCRFCRSLEGNNPRELAAKILRFASRSGNSRDDMTVLVAGFWKK